MATFKWIKRSCLKSICALMSILSVWTSLLLISAIFTTVVENFKLPECNNLKQLAEETKMSKGAEDDSAEVVTRSSHQERGVDEEEKKNEAENFNEDDDYVGFLSSSKNGDSKKRHENAASRTGLKIWDHWGKWSSCTVTCGIGKITRWRHCVAGGCATGEKEAQIKTCTLPAC